jgi:hypothetical protein
LTIWPVEGDLFGIDVRWAGGAGNRRATIVYASSVTLAYAAASLKRSTAPGKCELARCRAVTSPV